MTSRVKRQAPLLLALAKAHPHVCKAILNGIDKDLLQCLSEFALNILKGNVTLKPSEKAKLTPVTEMCGGFLTIIQRR